jgi:glutamine synthetase
MGATPSDVIAMAKSEGVKVVDLRFADLFGVWQHLSIPVSAFTESVFEEGVGFDGSSIRGFQEIHESDLILIPDPSTAFVDPFLDVPTLVLICDVYDPVTRERYSRDPRYIAQKAEKFLLSTGIADKSYWGPEAEFFIFNDVRYAISENSCFHFVDSREGIWNSGREEGPNLGYKLRFKEGYFPAPPSDTLQDIRSEIMLTLEKIGIQCEVHHHEVATGGQGEVDLRYDTLTRMADKLMIFKYVVKMVARKHNMTATFMPKPLSGDNGNGMHTHQSLWRGNENLFYDERGYAQLSSIARYYIGGLLKHAPALLAFCAPTLNSYRRLIPGFEAPTRLAYSQRNRSACIRIPVYSQSPESKRIEFRPPDPSCNPYLAFSAMLMAGIDGILNRIDPGAPLDKNIYDLPPEEAKAVPTLPPSLEDAINCLEADNAFLMRGDVFTEDVIRVWIERKRNEANSIKPFPHPYEFFLYYDV